MDERTFWRMVEEYLAQMQTSGLQPNPGGDLPYDDYGLQNQIGVGPAPAAPPVYEDWAQFGPQSDSEPAMTQPAIGSAAVAGDGMFLGAPYAPDAQPLVTAPSPRADALALVLAQLQAGLEHAHANNSRVPSSFPVARSGEPYFDEYDQAMGPYRRPINQPAPLTGLFGNPAPSVAPPRAPQAAQQIVRQARQSQSAPMTSAPASRIAAQTPLATALNAVRSRR